MENEMNTSNNELLSYPSMRQQQVDRSTTPRKDYNRQQDHGVVDIQQIKKAIEFAQNNIKMREQGEHMVIFWGYTGTGKSTTIIILNGQKVYGYDKYGIPILINKINQQEQKQIKQRLKQGQVVIFIEKNVESGTVYPSSLPMKITQKQEKVIMWDTPGFGDTKGITQALINTYFIHRLFNLQQKVKLVLTINFNDLIIDQKGDKLKRIIKTISQALRKFKNYEESMAILITKATQTASVEGVINLFKQNKRLNYINESEQIKKFFEIVCDRRIPILVIKRPKIKQQDTKQKPREVTNDYIEFTQEFYKTVINLRAAIVPNLKAPGMSQEEVAKCVNFGKEVKKKIMQLTMEMINNLLKYIQSQYQQISFGDNLQKNKNSLNISAKMKEFVNVLQKIITKKCQTKIQFHQNFQDLADLFQRPNIKFKCENKDKSFTCIPMRTLRNEIIIIDFISSINIPEESLQYEKVMGEFFLVFVKKLQDFKDLIKKLEIEALNLYQAHIQNKFNYQLNLWINQQLFLQWNQNIKSFPSLYLKMISSKPENLIDCIESMKQIEGEAEFECTKYLEPLLCLINYNQDMRNFNFDEIKFIQEKLKIKLKNHLQKLKTYLDFNKWAQQQLDEIKIITKQRTVLKQKENQIRKLQNDAMCDVADYEVLKQNIEAHTRRQIQNLKLQVQKIEKEKNQISKQRQQLRKKLNQATQQNSAKEKRIANLQDQIQRQRQKVCPRCSIM